jgi:hypothetical protein
MKVFFAVAVILLSPLGPGVVQVTAAGPLKFYSVTPCRLIDTRDTSAEYPPMTIGPALQNGEFRSLPVWGASARACGIPPHAMAVAVNVVARMPSSVGHLTLFPYNTGFPGTSNVNFNAGEPALANGAVVTLTDDPLLQLSVTANMAGPGNTVDFVLDVTGYFQ